MIASVDYQQGVQDAWTRIATFVPKFVGFLVILLIGWLIAKALSKLVERLLQRVGFDRWVERGSLKPALDSAHTDASDILGVIVFWTVFLLALQLAFGVFGPNPISDLLHGLIAYLPNVFVAVVILVITAALAKVVADLLGATLGAVSGGQWIARAAGLAILIVGIFAALNQLKVAPAIVNGLFYAILAIIVGSAVVAIGGGGIQTMRRYWEQTSGKLEAKGREIQRNADPEAARQRMEEMAPDAGRTAPMTRPDEG
jgi:mechanosensitive ion channel-like protein